MSNINLEDMTELINIFDGYNRLTNIAYDLLGMNSSDGKSVLSEIAKVISIIERHSILYQAQEKPLEDYIESVFWKTLSDGSLTAEERAARLLNCNRESTEDTDGAEPAFRKWSERMSQAENDSASGFDIHEFMKKVPDVPPDPRDV